MQEKVLPARSESLPKLTRHLAGSELMIKRDDLTGIGLGGNKVRKLECLIGQVISESGEMELTTGAA